MAVLCCVVLCSIVLYCDALFCDCGIVELLLFASLFLSFVV
jgi:hypothetical protein